MHGDSIDEEEGHRAKFKSAIAAFVAFMSLDARTQARLRVILLMSKSVEEAKDAARQILQNSLPGLMAQPTVG